MTQDNIELRIAQKEDLDTLSQIKDAKKYYERCLQERTIIIARLNGQDVGYGMFNENPKYSLYRKLSIPEIQDVFVLPEARQHGVATVIINKCESIARDKGCEYIGISVGLHSGYGAAQRLYAKIGYIPDGNGVTYDRHPVSEGERRPVDDDLCLMMVKTL